MTTYYEDETYDLADFEPAELGLTSGFTTAPALSRLHAALVRYIIAEANTSAAYRAVVKLASGYILGGIIPANMVRPDNVKVLFRSRRQLTDVDLDMQPFYGSVIPALEEMLARGLSESMYAYWLDWFRRDNAAVRVVVVAQILTAMGGLQQGISGPVLGTPNALAQLQKVTIAPTVTNTAYSSAVVLRGTSSSTGAPVADALASGTSDATSTVSGAATT